MHEKTDHQGLPLFRPGAARRAAMEDAIDSLVEELQPWRPTASQAYPVHPNAPQLIRGPRNYGARRV